MKNRAHDKPARWIYATSMRKTLTHDEEVQRLLDRFDGPQRWQTLTSFISSHMNVLQTRAQVLLTLCGAVVTVTGFSGRIVAQSGLAAQILIGLGLLFSLLAAAMCVFRVMPIYWLSQVPGATDEQWLSTALAYRDEKTQAYRLAMIMLLLGITLYIAAMGLMIVFPDAAPLSEGIR